MSIAMTEPVTIRALEKNDLVFIHQLNNDRGIMTYWFEEPYNAYDELEDLYNKHLHDDKERRFIAENQHNEPIGIVELVNINYTHRTAEFQIIIAPKFQGAGLARQLIISALDYAFTILNLHKVYLQVAINNHKAIHLYQEAGFIKEGHLIKEIFVEGDYTDVIRMYTLQEDFIDKIKQNST